MRNTADGVKSLSDASVHSVIYSWDAQVGVLRLENIDEAVHTIPSFWTQLYN